jgi:hypothetical protein
MRRRECQLAVGVTLEEESMRTSRKHLGNSSRLVVRGVLAATLVIAAAETARAADVRVVRAGDQVFVSGGDEDDHLVLSSPEAGLLHVEGADDGTTVNGETGVDLDLGPRDAFYVLLGDGSNTVLVEGMTKVRKFVVIGGSDDDVLTLRGAEVPNGILFLGQDGTDVISVEAGSHVAGDLVAVMGEGGDTFLATQATFSREIVVDLGGGAINLAHLDNSTASSTVTVLGGTGRDTVTISGGSVRRLTQIDLGDGDDALNIGAGARFDGAFSFRGGDDRDTVTVFGAATFARKAVFDMGRDDDTGNFGLALYSRDLRIVGGDGDDKMSLAEFTVDGRLLLLCGSGTDSVTSDDTLPFTLGNGGRIDGGIGQDTSAGGAGSGARFLRFETVD